MEMKQTRPTLDAITTHGYLKAITRMQTGFGSEEILPIHWTAEEIDEKHSFFRKEQ